MTKRGDGAWKFASTYHDPLEYRPPHRAYRWGAHKVLVTGGRSYGDPVPAIRRDGRYVVKPKDQAKYEMMAMRSVLSSQIHYANMNGLVPVLIHGNCPYGGADINAANLWAREFQRPVVAVPARWKDHGRVAGPMRNGVMVAGTMFGDERAFEPDICIAFPGGKGTADTVNRARKALVPVIEVYPVSEYQEGEWI